MEMLAAMMAGAVGGVVGGAVGGMKARGAAGHAEGRWPATLLGIIGGGAAWWILGAIGPDEKAGPLLMWHLVGGALLGGALAALAVFLLGRAAR